MPAPTRTEDGGPIPEILIEGARVIRGARGLVKRFEELYPDQKGSWDGFLVVLEQSVLDAIPDDPGFDVGFALNDALAYVYQEEDKS